MPWALFAYSAWGLDPPKGFASFARSRRFFARSRPVERLGDRPKVLSIFAMFL